MTDAEGSPMSEDLKSSISDPKDRCPCGDRTMATCSGECVDPDRYNDWKIRQLGRMAASEPTGWQTSGPGDIALTVDKPAEDATASESRGAPMREFLERTHEVEYSGSFEAPTLTPELWKMFARLRDVTPHQALGLLDDIAEAAERMRDDAVREFVRWPPLQFILSDLPRDKTLDDIVTDYLAIRSQGDDSS